MLYKPSASSLGTSVLICSLLLTLISFVSQTQTASAQIPTNALVCPIDGEVSVSTRFFDETIVVENVLEEIITLENTTGNFLPAVSIGVGFYAAESDNMPTYWTVLSDQYDLPDGARLTLPLSLDLTSVPAGQYVVKLFTTQGGVDAALGMALRDVAYVESFVLEKNTTPTTQIDLNLQINEQSSETGIVSVAKKDDINITLTAENKSDLVLRDTNSVLILTEGDIPLGSAVVDVRQQETKILPNSTRSHSFSTRALQEGEYSVYGVLLTTNKLQPVTKSTLQFGELSGRTVWPYVSILALTEFPATSNTELFACVDYYGQDRLATRLQGDMQVAFIGTRDETEVFRKTETNDDPSKLYFNVELGKELNNTQIETVLYETTYSNLAGESVSKPTLVEAQKINVSLNCSEALPCNAPNQSSQNERTYETNTAGIEPPWFYFGIILASLLLMYLMISRLGTKDNSIDKNLSESELQ